LSYLCPGKCPVPSAARGVGHPIKTGSDMGRADAASWQYSRPDGVADSLQVIVYSIEPPVLNRLANLLANNRLRLFDESRTDEFEELGPEVAGVVEAELLSGRREALAGTGGCDDRPIRVPASEAERERPPANTREEVELVEAFKVFRRDFEDGARVDFSKGYLSCDHQVLDPLTAERVDFVVVVQTKSPRKDEKSMPSCGAVSHDIDPWSESTSRLMTRVLPSPEPSMADSRDPGI